jgi:hypothetical protein
MTESIRNSLLLLAIICPVYIAIVGSCCSDQCPDPNPCTSECYAKPSGGCPNPAANPYSLADGTECQFAGGQWGQCNAGICSTHECAGIQDLFACDNPRTTAETGICIEDRCVASGNDDACVKPNFGRMNCCTIAGCQSANGTQCGDSDRTVLDGQSCDPTGVLPVGQGSGTCQNGICTYGSFCTGVDNGDGTYGPCDSGEICQKDVCVASSSSCQNSPSDGELPCSGPTGAGVCSGGLCAGGADCAVDCSDNNPCTADRCNGAKLVGGACPNKICCENAPKPAATPCTQGGNHGVCDADGNCLVSNTCGP